MQKLIGLVALVAMLASALPLLAQDKPILAVMEIEDKTGKFTDTQIQDAATYLRSKLEVAGTFMVVAKSRQEKALIRELRKESYKDCYAEQCQIELGKELAADTIARTTLMPVGDDCVLSTVMLNLASAASTGGAQHRFECHVDGLTLAVERVTNSLIKKSASSNDKHSAEEYLRRPRPEASVPARKTAAHTTKSKPPVNRAGIGRWRVFAGPALRLFSPVFQNEPGADGASLYDLDQDDSPPLLMGVEVGGSYRVFHGFRMFARAQFLFSTDEPVLSYFTNGADQFGNLYQNSDGTSTLLKADVVSLWVFSGTLGVGYDFVLWKRLHLLASIGLAGDSVQSDAPKLGLGKSGEPYSKVEPWNIGGRAEFTVEFDTLTRWSPFLAMSTVFPREYYDWSVSAGVVVRL